MSPDELAIRSVIDTWMRASGAGDLPKVLELMDDDVVFLAPGRPPMRKDGFVVGSRAMEGKTQVDGKDNIQEIRVFGDWAYCWNQLSVTMHPIDGGAPTRLSGSALSVSRRRADGAWVLFRDANMITPSQ